ncbi:hypothetical protein HYN69_08365 [Gemmobacter aquarius]|uniref:DUF2934 domain-containing protein n=1 Tax=Paragemmobacter aquarius TaxID=2169400 RepID=A0A2S0UL47_9RHOB|nr:hypothetical protein [Gemmobacter aquarius]AWB48522.1 hypothetical protein HYN69_08365 [Gemmobacter aquarius]
MDRKDFDAWQDRVSGRARLLWTDAGEPEGGPERFEEQARELLAIEENPAATTKPVDGGPDAESLIAVENQGEFPTLTDQGEEQSYPATGPEWPDVPPAD